MNLIRMTSISVKKKYKFEMTKKKRAKTKNKILDFSASQLIKLHKAR